MLKLEKKDHQAQAIAALERGETVMFGEYRQYRIDEKEMAVKERPDLKEKRLIVTHSFEAAGSGEQIACTEWLPPGSRREDIKVSFNAGDRVLLIARTMKAVGSQRTVNPVRFEFLSKLLATA